MRTSRREFIRLTTSAAGALMLSSLVKSQAEITGNSTDLVTISNNEPGELTKSALDALGGIQRFISKGDKVVVKPNIGWDRNPEQAANTHPDVVAELVRQCLEAGAKEVQVFDNTCHSAKRCYDNSGIAEAARKAGAKVSYVLKDFFVEVKIKDAFALKKWEFYKPALEADKYINVPILKQHSLSGLTIGLKNIMGVIGGNRGAIHNNFDPKIVDLNSVIKPTLTIVDASRILLRNGPTGGNLGDVVQKRQLIAGIDPVAVDASAADLFGIPHQQLGFIHTAIDKGLGSLEGLKYMKTIDLES